MHKFYVPLGTVDYEKQVASATMLAVKGKKVEFHNHPITVNVCNEKCWTTENLVTTKMLKSGSYGKL